jgi:hypothetical protein
MSYRSLDAGRRTDERDKENHGDDTDFRLGFVTATAVIGAGSS